MTYTRLPSSASAFPLFSNADTFPKSCRQEVPTQVLFMEIRDRPKAASTEINETGHAFLHLTKPGKRDSETGVKGATVETLNGWGMQWTT